MGLSRFACQSLCHSRGGTVAGASNKFWRLGKAVLKVRQEGGKLRKDRQGYDHQPLRFMQCGKTLHLIAIRYTVVTLLKAPAVISD
jgi:hypothetical protein